MRRRTFLKLLAGPALRPAFVQATERPLRIGLTPVILDDRVDFLRRWAEWIETRLGQPVDFVQRAKYQEIVDLLDRGRLDAAWICGYPYVRHLDTLRLLAVPVYQGEPLYRAYLITSARNTEVQGLTDLKGGVFAFSDPLSNSGYLYPVYRLHQLFPHQPEPLRRLFRRTFFTCGHRHVIEAVASGLADAGSVDGYVWDQLQRLHPELTRQTRIFERSPKFGFPPLVTTRHMAPERRAALADLLGRMHEDPVGQPLLRSLGLDRFTFRTTQLYAGIALMANSLAQQERR